MMIPATHNFIVSANDKYKSKSMKIMITLTAITANPSKNIIKASLIEPCYNVACATAIISPSNVSNIYTVNYLAFIATA